MPFVPMHQQANVRTDWDRITHIRLIAGKRPDTRSAMRRWEALSVVAGKDGVIALEKVFEVITPIRNKGGHETSIKFDLRCWSNLESHGNNPQDKGWLELGAIVGG